MHSGLVYCSGQLGIDLATGTVIDGDAGAQTRAALAHMSVVLKASGSDLSRVLRTTVYLADLSEFAEMNREYERAFGSHRPARVTVEVAALPLGGRVEIDCIASVAAPKASDGAGAR